MKCHLPDNFFEAYYHLKCQGCGKIYIQTLNMDALTVGQETGGHFCINVIRDGCNSCWWTVIKRVTCVHFCKCGHPKYTHKGDVCRSCKCKGV